jgi:pimeloyl-ACP methyl ester carboxylesterase
MNRLTQPETGFAEVDGTRLYYETLGEGHPLVLIHGGYMDRRMWDDQFYVFSQHYRVIRYDVRGFGKSELQVTIAGTHHMPNMEKPEEFNAIVLDFLGKL